MTKKVASTEKNLASIDQLKGELAKLWDMATLRSEPLKPEIVYTESDKKGYPGYKVEGIYVNGAKGEAGTDRIFFYYSRPEKPLGKLPVYIELTGGAENEVANLWMASALNCAVVHVEYRCTRARFRSNWAGYPRANQPTPTLQDMSSLRNNFLYRMISGTRRVMDYLAAQPEIDAANMGCGGGSMGGYLTLLLAGVDARVRFGADELAAGWKTAPQSGFGNLLRMPDQYKTLWSKAFNVYSFAASTKARMYVNVSADDAQFWLGDSLDNYRALPAEKRLGICPNDNHTCTSFGKEHFLPLFTWVPYCLGVEKDYPEIHGFKRQGDRHFVTVKDSAAVRDVFLYWSPGEKLAWPSRYWTEVKATLADARWQAEIPAGYGKLAKCVFMNAWDVKGRRVSSVPMFEPGMDPRNAAGPLWEGGQLWDVQHGASAWRPIGGVAARRGAMKSTVAFSAPHGLIIGPEKGSTDFTLLTNSILLASGHAPFHRGLEFEIDGNGREGELLIVLARNTGSVKSEQEFSYTLKYDSARKRYQVAWRQFTSAKSSGTTPIPFDGLRIDGRRSDGSTIVLSDVSFF